jgi:hypothetical protein
MGHLPQEETGTGARSATDIVRELNSQGIACLRSFFDGQAVDAMRNEALAFLDADKDSAAFRYCPGSHAENLKLRNRLLALGGNPKRLPNAAGPSEDIALIDVEGPAGTLIIFDSEGFHSAGSLKAGRERLIARWRNPLSSWFDNKFLRSTAELNPLKYLVTLAVPKGRYATGGSAQAKWELH